ncbi:Co-chaperone Hsc20 [Durotheca rogersii]|uniref:Co-chaperone Hsc20 n=1 Tax=Durotheca rogersii TaxID=419775 RepID=UPI00221F0849|nr:Co-chaperone Hsc20 [Durotheca rogersii]KAI5862604.1 Co-chaperone Hsc20 [Durotheca rogersii]
MRSSFLPVVRPTARRALCGACHQQRQQRGYATPPGFLLSLRRSPRPLARLAQDQHAAQTRHLSASPFRAIAAPASEGGGGRGQAQPESKNSEPRADPAPPPLYEVPKYYDLFPKTLPLGPPPAGPFAIDVRALRSEFLALQATAHPDRFPMGGVERRAAEARSAHINEAYRTLGSPMHRAQYLLRLRASQLAGSSSSSSSASESASAAAAAAAEAALAIAEDEAGRVDDGELLAAVLEARERIEEARTQREVDAAQREAEDRAAEAEGRLAGLFAADRLREAAETLVRMRYWIRIRETARQWDVREAEGHRMHGVA